MNNPFFSILIPTRQRHVSLHYAIKTVLAQDFQDFELVIMDNNGSPETKEVTNAFDDERIAYHRSNESLSMTENWELGLSKVQGQYVTVIGDDDGLLPDALSRCFELIKQYQVPIVSWYRWPYFWPNAPQQQNSLYVPFSSTISLINGRDLLKKVYQCEIVCEHFPTLYNSFVSANLIKDIKQKNNGNYYSVNCFCPDVFSGAVNAFFCDQYVHSARPLSLSGISGASNFATLTQTNSKPAQDWRQEEGRKKFHPALKLSDKVDVATTLTIVSDFLWAKDVFFPLCRDIELNLPGMIQSAVLDQANSDPERYDYYLDVARQMIHALNLESHHFNVPAKSPSHNVTNPPNRWLGSPNSPSGIILNCSLLGITDVFDAVTLCYKVMIEDIKYSVSGGQPYVKVEDVSCILKRNKKDCPALNSFDIPVVYF
jgi:glycosyltransferase involved in cell wall biosynthesis